MTSGCVSSPAATATAAHRTAARFQPGQNAHQPGSAVLNQPGTPLRARVPADRNVVSVRRRPSGAPDANRAARTTTRATARDKLSVTAPRRPGRRSRGMPGARPNARPAR